MAAENFNIYTASDIPGRLTRTSSRVTWTDILAGDDQVFLSKDKGAAFFDGSFVHTLTINQTASERGASYSGFWALTNDLLDLKGLRTGGKDALYVQTVHPQNPDVARINVFEVDGGTLRGSGVAAFVITEGVIYYLAITRNETIGSFGEIKLQIYSDAARTTLLHTESFNLHTSKKDFRYAMVAISEDATVATTKKASGYSEDLDIMGVTQGVTPVVGTTVPTDIDATSATGRGTIVDLGLAAVTAHGMVWDTSAIDTSVVPGSQPNSTDEGAGAVGGFTSSITGLTGGIIYFARAYATNSFGTGYGGGVQWKSGASYSTKEWGDTSMKGNELHTVGEDGVERAHMGTPV